MWRSLRLYLRRQMKYWYMRDKTVTYISLLHITEIWSKGPCLHHFMNIKKTHLPLHQRSLWHTPRWTKKYAIIVNSDCTFLLFLSVSTAVISIEISIRIMFGRAADRCLRSEILSWQIGEVAKSENLGERLNLVRELCQLGWRAWSHLHHQEMRRLGFRSSMAHLTAKDKCN